MPLQMTNCLLSLSPFSHFLPFTSAYLRLLQEEKLITTHSTGALVPNLYSNFGLNDPKSDAKQNVEGQENINPDSNHYNNEKECVVCMDSERNAGEWMNSKSKFSIIPLIDYLESLDYLRD